MNTFRRLIFALYGVHSESTDPTPSTLSNPSYTLRETDTFFFIGPATARVGRHGGGENRPGDAETVSKRGIVYKV